MSVGVVEDYYLQLASSAVVLFRSRDSLSDERQYERLPGSYVVAPVWRTPTASASASATSSAS